MTLQASGTLGFSEIVGEFGGAGSHSLSEYRALSGKGVVGIPAAGAISFSAFRGKSNQVTTSVWTASGYDESAWIQTTTNLGSTSYWVFPQYGVGSLTVNGTYYGASQTGSASPSGVNAVPITVGNTIYSGGAYYQFTLSPQDNPRYWFRVAVQEYQTYWVDTSGYVDTTTTAQITT